jgi:hypothetical protein
MDGGAEQIIPTASKPETGSMAKVVTSSKYSNDVKTPTFQWWLSSRI